MAKHIRHIRHHARKHEEAHSRLKELLSRALHTEKVWDIFVGTFVVAIVSIVLFLNWGNITSFFIGDKEVQIAEEEVLRTAGFQTGVLATYVINGQSADQYIRLVRKIDTGGAMIGLDASKAVGAGEEEKAEASKNVFLSSIILSNDLSKGAHLTSLDTAKTLQKSVLTTFYLGEKTVDITSTLQTDSELLSKISATLSVDIFAYLNQSENRADSLEGYLNLLTILEAKAQERSADLSSKVNFLSANFEAQERSITLTEEAFFQNLQIFEGDNAEQELAEFIGLEQEQAEVRAKIGAYQTLKDYYDFFLPRLDNLIRAINANRDPLIAGVKVVEIQNMTLPLIIRER